MDVDLLFIVFHAQRVIVEVGSSDGWMEYWSVKLLINTKTLIFLFDQFDMFEQFAPIWRIIDERDVEI